jgi:hypothetical protein
VVRDTWTIRIEPINVTAKPARCKVIIDYGPGTTPNDSFGTTLPPSVADLIREASGVRFATGQTRNMAGTSGGGQCRWVELQRSRRPCCRPAPWRQVHEPAGDHERAAEIQPAHVVPVVERQQRGDGDDVRRRAVAIEADQRAQHATLLASLATITSASGKPVVVDLHGTNATRALAQSKEERRGGSPSDPTARARSADARSR